MLQNEITKTMNSCPAAVSHLTLYQKVDFARIVFVGFCQLAQSKIYLNWFGKVSFSKTGVNICLLCCDCHLQQYIVTLASQAPLQARKTRLMDAQKLRLFLHDVEDEEAWIREKDPIASSTNTGWFVLIM